MYKYSKKENKCQLCYNERPVFVVKCSESHDKFRICSECFLEFMKEEEEHSDQEQTYITIPSPEIQEKKLRAYHVKAFEQSDPMWMQRNKARRFVQTNDKFTGFDWRDEDGFVFFLSREALDPSWAVEITDVDLTKVQDNANM